MCGSRGVGLGLLDMFRHAVILFFLVVVAAIADEHLQSAVALGNNVFGLNASRELREVYKDTDATNNIWISPFSITSCVSLLYPGSAGLTQSQMAFVMGFPTDSAVDTLMAAVFNASSSIQSIGDANLSGNRSRSIIGIANKVYISKEVVVKPTYIDILNNGGDVYVETSFDFKADNASAIINHWIQKSTHGLVGGIVENAEVTNWQMAALSTIVLNATFQYSFQPGRTSLNPFYRSLLRRYEVSECHMMHQMGSFDYYEDENYQFLKFPFNRYQDLFALFVLPKNPEVYFEAHGLITDWNVVLHALNQLETTYIALALPKLRVAEQYKFKKVLMDMGMTHAFSEFADFSKISDFPLAIDRVIHGTTIEMDEYGLIAAAMTIHVMTYSIMVTMEPNPVLFKADHSFQMMIIDGEHDNTLLFTGQINDPGIPIGALDPRYDESRDPIWTDKRVFNASTLVDLLDETRYAIPETTKQFVTSGQIRFHSYLGASALPLTIIVLYVF